MSSNQPTKDLAEALAFMGVADLDIDQFFKTALKNGGSLAEIFFEKSAYTRVSIEDGKVDQLIDGIDGGLGLRVIFDHRFVYGYTTQLDSDSLFRLAESLATAVKSGEGSQSLPIEEWRAVDQPDQEMDRYQIQKSVRDLSLSDKIDIARRIEAGARSVLPDARQVMGMVLDRERNIIILNSDGAIARDKKTYFQMVSQVVAEKEGRVESAYETRGGYVGLEFLDEVSPEKIGSSAADRVSILLNAKPAPAGTMPVVMSADAGGTMIHEAVGHGLEADLACNGLSVYEGKVGEQVASSLITVIDDGTMPGKRGSYRVDDEGTPSKKNVLIENGILKGYMVDRISAMKFDLMATGNGRRESFRHKPIVRMTNTYIAPGKDDPEQILKDTKWGVFVKAMGGGQVNTVTGDFVFAVTEAYLIKDGKLGDPIRGATLVGNGPKALSIVDRVGNDLGFATGTCGKDGQGAPVTDAQPTLRIPELTVGGEVPIETYWDQATTA